MNLGVETTTTPVSSMAAMGATSTLHNSLATYMTQQVQPNLLFGLGQQQQPPPAQQQPLNLQTSHQGQPTMQAPPHQAPGSAAPPAAAPPLPLNLHNPYYVSLGPMLPLPMSTPQHNHQQQFQQNMLQQQQGIPGGFNQHTMYQWGRAVPGPTHYHPSPVPAQHQNQYCPHSRYQHSWSTSGPVPPTNTVAPARQVSFPPSYASSQPHQCYLPNSVPQVASSQNFAYVPSSEQGTSLPQPVYQNVSSNNSPQTTCTPDNQKVSHASATLPTSLGIPGPSGNFSKPDPPTPAPQQTIIVVPTSVALQNNYIIKNLQSTPQPSLPHGFVSPQVVVDKSSSAPSPITTQAGTDPKGKIIYLPS